MSATPVVDTPNAQLEANRANARLSTGPRTEAGKSASSRNAVKHGFLATVLPAEQQDYRDLLDDLVVDLQPASLIQRLIVEEVALAYIRLRRIHAAEMVQMEPRNVRCETWNGKEREIEIERTSGQSPQDLLRDKQAHLVLRYETTIERHIQRCLTRLKEMKGDHVWKTLTRAAGAARQPATETASQNPAGSTAASPPECPSPPLHPPSLIELLEESKQWRSDQRKAVRGNGFVSQKDTSEHRASENGFVSQNRGRRKRATAPAAVVATS
jgi:hypothetical protein